MDKLSDQCYPLPLKIIGMGRYLPKRVISSNELEEKYSLEKGWCEAKLGVAQRRWVEDETPSFMGAEAAREAIGEAGLDPDDIDLIINASGTASLERGLPDGGPLLQQQLGLESSGIPAFSVQNNCLSFMLALDVCATLLATGRYQVILAVSSEILSLNLDSNNPHVYGLFADGSAAAILTRTPEGENSALHSGRFETYGNSSTYLQSLLGKKLESEENLNPRDLTLQMDEKAFIENGNKYTHQLLEILFKTQNIDRKNIDIVIPQQVGKAYLEPLTRLFPPEKVKSIINHFGNCGAASLPMALYEAIKNKELVRGNRFLLTGVGAGMSTGAMILTY